MSCKHFDESVKVPLDEDLSEFEIGSNPKVIRSCTIKKDEKIYLNSDEVLNYCNDVDGYLRCNKGK